MKPIRDLAKDRQIAHLVLTERKPLIISYTSSLGVTLSKNLGLIVKPDQADPGLPTKPIPISGFHNSLNFARQTDHGFPLTIDFDRPSKPRIESQLSDNHASDHDTIFV